MNSSFSFLFFPQRLFFFFLPLHKTTTEFTFIYWTFTFFFMLLFAFFQQVFSADAPDLRAGWGWGAGRDTHFLVRAIP